MTTDLYRDLSGNPLRRVRLSIRGVLGKFAGVQHIEVDVENKKVHAEYDDNQIDGEKIAERLTLAGFPPEQV